MNSSTAAELKYYTLRECVKAPEVLKTVIKNENIKGTEDNKRPSTMSQAFSSIISSSSTIRHLKYA